MSDQAPFRAQSGNVNAKSGSVRALMALNFCIADVQNGMGPSVALFLQSAVGWNPAQIGTALAAGNLVQVAAQTPAGALIDALKQKRALLVVGIVLIAVASLATVWLTSLPVVTTAQACIGLAGAIFPPCLAAIALGLVGRERMDRQMGTNQAFNAGGNMFAALAIGAVGHLEPWLDESGKAVEDGYCVVVDDAEHADFKVVGDRKLGMIELKATPLFKRMEMLKHEADRAKK